MANDIAATSYLVLNVGRAKIRFGGVDGRPSDEQHHDLFAVQLPDQPLVYGEWRQKWAIAVIEDLVRRLFTSVEARSDVWPFSSKKGRFLEHIEFRAGWIRIHPRL